MTTLTVKINLAALKNATPQLHQDVVDALHAAAEQARAETGLVIPGEIFWDGIAMIEFRVEPRTEIPQKLPRGRQPYNGI